MNESRREREKELFFFFFLLLPFLRLSIEDLGVVVGFWFQPKKKKKKGEEPRRSGHWPLAVGPPPRKSSFFFFFPKRKKKSQRAKKERRAIKIFEKKKKWPPCRSGRSAAIGRPRWLIENERFIQSFITHTANQLGSAFKGQLVDGVGVTGPPAFHQRPTGDDE